MVRCGDQTKGIVLMGTQSHTQIQWEGRSNTFGYTPSSRRTKQTSKNKKSSIWAKSKIHLTSAPISMHANADKTRFLGGGAGIFLLLHLMAKHCGYDCSEHAFALDACMHFIYFHLFITVHHQNWTRDKKTCLTRQGLAWPRQCRSLDLRPSRATEG